MLITGSLASVVEARRWCREIGTGRSGLLTTYSRHEWRFIAFNRVEVTENSIVEASSLGDRTDQQDSEDTVQT